MEDIRQTCARDGSQSVSDATHNSVRPRLFLLQRLRLSHLCGVSGDLGQLARKPVVVVSFFLCYAFFVFCLKFLGPFDLNK